MAREGTNITVNIPDILMGHARRAVQAKKEEVAAYSMGDLVRDALRGYLTPDHPIYKDNGYVTVSDESLKPGFRVTGVKPTTQISMSVPIPPGVKPSVADLVQRFGIKTGATIEEVEPFVETGLPGSLTPEESLPGVSEYQTTGEKVDYDLEQQSLFIREFGRQAWDRAIRIPAFKKARWPERFEMAREQKERGE